jgi:hypothetical protein
VTSLMVKGRTLRLVALCGRPRAPRAVLALCHAIGVCTLRLPVIRARLAAPARSATSVLHTAWLGILIASTHLACGPGDDIPGVGGSGGNAGAQCPPGTSSQTDGSCRPPGMLPEDCATGFQHVPFDVPATDARYGGGRCEPVLPSDACEPGLMAVPGDATCRPIADCGSGKWGAIPVDATTQYVDAAYVGSGDGSPSSPWNDILEALNAASTGGIVAVAAGTYNGDLPLQKPVRLWGVCPEKVEIVGTSNAPSAIGIFHQADGTEIHNVSVTGPVVGLQIEDAMNVVVANVRIHDCGVGGLLALHTAGPGSFSLTDSLIENNNNDGILLQGASATIERSEVRSAAPNQNDWGVTALACFDTCSPPLASDITVRGSVIAGSGGVGFTVSGSTGQLDASVVRASSPERGISLMGTCTANACDPNAPAIATVSRSFIDSCSLAGVFVAGSEVTLTSTTIRNTLPRPSDLLFGRGLDIELNCVNGTCAPASHSHVQASGSVIEASYDIGVFVASSELSLESSVIQGTVPRTADGLFGDGLAAVSAQGSGSSVTLAGSVVADSAATGVAAFESALSLGSTVIECAAVPVAIGAPPASLEDRGGNECGCPAADGSCEPAASGPEQPEMIVY